MIFKSDVKDWMGARLARQPWIKERVGKDSGETRLARLVVLIRGVDVCTREMACKLERW